MSPDRVVAELRIARPAAEVWAALRERDQLLQWFGWDHPGHAAEVDQIFFGHANEVEPGRVLDTGDGVFRVEADGDATLVRVTRAAPPDSIDDGWRRFAGQLADHLEGRPVDRTPPA